MHIVALVESPEHVCCRYRLRSVFAGLAVHGVSTELRPILRGLSSWKIGGGLGHADWVVLQRKLLPRWMLMKLRWRVNKLAFDFDDAIFQRDSYHTKGPQSAKLERRFGATVRAADAVIAGNLWLGERAFEAGAEDVHVIPTCIDATKYKLAKHEHNKPLTLVWVGSRSTLQGLARAKPLLEQIGQAIPGLTLRLVCDAFLDFQHLKVERVQWTEQNEAQAISTADVGLSMLPDDDWSRGKCGLKVLQYLAAGLPVVGNPVGVSSEIVTDSAGYLANTTDEWVNALKQLHDPKVRQQMGAAGRKRVEQHYSVDTAVNGWLRLVGKRSGTRESSDGSLTPSATEEMRRVG